VALGHPIGASGARTLVTLINAMRRRGARIGIVALCLGGGEAGGDGGGTGFVVAGQKTCRLKSACRCAALGASRGGVDQEFLFRIVLGRVAGDGGRDGGKLPAVGGFFFDVGRHVGVHGAGGPGDSAEQDVLEYRAGPDVFQMPMEV